MAPIQQQIIALLVCFVLCSLLGVERHFHHKSAGVKTHVLAGLGSYLFTLISVLVRLELRLGLTPLVLQLRLCRE
ncbi:MgtC/SapB family protein [Trueperella pyogenes]|uniref:MgtC/SapB family protein n=1 Tax=Trueperella pyogenes TaxID=1661 RepID=UPI0021D53A3E|nr:MgtC/SapB family protein [Trueperella pyogenes]